MEPFEIRTTPATLSRASVVSAVLLLALAVLMVVIGVGTTILAARDIAGDPSKLAMDAVLLAVLYGLLWIFLRSYAPRIQLTLMYLFRDRGRHVVMYRIDGAGWRHVAAGTDVLVPWEGMTAEVTARTQDHFDVRVTSDGRFRAGWSPLSRHLRRLFRDERGFAAPMTNSEPTEDELAAAIAQQSAGRVALAR